MSHSWSLTDLTIRDVPAFTGLTAAAELTIPAIPTFAEKASSNLMRLADARAIPIVDAPVFVYTGVGVGANDTFRLQIALPVPPDTQLEGVDDQFALISYEPFRCAAFDFHGPMMHIGEAYPQAMNALKEAGHTPVEQSREVYKWWVAYDSPDNVIEIQLGIA